MTTTIDAIYEGGVFRPTRQVALSEGTRVEVIVPQAAVDPDPRTVAARLAQIAAGVSQNRPAESTSVNHDRILYGNTDQP